MRLYFDKNILTAMMKDDASEEKKIIRKFIETNYFLVPFSDAHIKDLLNSDMDYLVKDLQYIEGACGDTFFKRDFEIEGRVNYFKITSQQAYNNIVYDMNIVESFDELMLSLKEDPLGNIAEILFDLKICPNIINQLPDYLQTPFYDQIISFSKETDTLTIRQLFEFGMKLLHIFESNPTYYVEYRKLIASSIGTNLHDNKSIQHLENLDQLFEGKIGKKFSLLVQDIAKAGKNKPPTFEEQFYQAYLMLDQFGLITDKINSGNTYKNISNDANHALYGAFCDIIVSEDKKLRDKAKTVYEFMKIETQVLSEKEFIEYLGNFQVVNNGNFMDNHIILHEQLLDDTRVYMLKKEYFFGTYFDTCEIEQSLTDNLKCCLFYNSKTNKRGWHYDELKMVVDKLISVFGNDSDKHGPYSEEENKQVHDKVWQGRTWILNNSIANFSITNMPILTIIPQHLSSTS